MCEAIRVIIRVDARIVCGKLLHFVEAVFNGVKFGLIAQMPFTRVIGTIAVFLEKLGNGRR
jgi:hypothetical protein